MRPLLLSILLALTVFPALAEDPAALFTRLKPVAERGDAAAQYHLGMMYNNGIGTPADPRQAFAWFQKSAAGGDGLGAYKLGCYYEGQFKGVIDQDNAKALEYKLMAAQSGYSLAQFDVANLYVKSGNAEEAVKWWRMSADQGFPLALYNLSVAYYDGKGVKKDLAQAYIYFKLAKLISENAVSPAAQAMLDELKAKMAKGDVEKAEKYIAEWKPQPSPLTVKASQGIEAAEQQLQLSLALAR